MFDTQITIVGNVCTKPVQRQFPAGALTDFRMASTSRRFDRKQDRWVDGDELFIRVACWRSLGEHVYQSLEVGDPIIVRGRLFSRKFVDGNDQPRVTYEVNAQAVGHDLSRGVARFSRQASAPGSRGGAGASGDAEFDAIVQSIADIKEESAKEAASATT